MTLEVLMPCDVVEIQVTLAPERNLTRLEELALEAIHAGVDSLGALSSMFALSERLTLDLVWGMWTQQHVLVDLARRRIKVTPRVGTLIQAGRLAELSSSRVDTESWLVAIEPASGFVGAEMDTTFPYPGAAIAPMTTRGLRIEDADEKDLLAAVLRTKESRERRAASGGRASRRVLGVDLAHAARRSPTQRKFMQIEMEMQRLDDDSYVVVAGEGPAGLTSAHRRRIEAYIGELAAVNPGARVVSQLLDASPSSLAPPPSLEELVERQRSDVEHFAPVDDVARQHDKLADRAAAMAREFEHRRDSACDVELVVGAANLRSEALRLIDEARRQVVIVSPWVGARALNTVIDHLVDAMGRGVDVIIAWGINARAVLDGVEANLLADLARRYPTRFTYAHRPARTHAKLVVADDRHALISSHNLLSSDDRLIEIGARLSALPGRPCPPIEELLRWVRRTYPDYVKSRGFLHDRSGFEPTWNRADGARSGLPVCPTAPAAPEVVAAWAKAWLARVEDVERGLASMNEYVAGVVTNQEHRGRLYAAFRTSRRRVVVGTEKVGSEAFGPELVGAAKAFLAAHPDGTVTFVHRAGEVDELAREEMEHLTAAGAGRFAALAVPGWHAKLLIADDDAVLSSFNFLSFEGRYLESARRARSEIGVHVRSGPVADTLHAAIFELAGLPAPEPAVRAMRSRSAGATGTDIALLDAVQAVVSAPDDAVDATFDAAAAGVGRWALVAALQEVVFPVDRLERQVARGLLADPVPPEEWSDWLGLRAWGTNRFLDAAYLLQRSSVARPRSALRAATAAMGTSAMGQAMAAIECHDLDASEQVAVLLVACIGLLDGAAECEAVVNQLAAAIPAVADATLAYWRREYTAVPWAMLERRAGATRHREAVRAHRDLVVEQAEKIRRIHYDFGEGRTLVNHLRRRDSSIGDLLSRIDDDRPLDEWIDAWGPDGNRFIDRHQLVLGIGEIHSKRRRALRDHVDTLMRRVAALDDTRRDDPAVVAITPSLAALQERFAVAAGELDDAALVVADSERPAVAAVIRRLKALLP